MLAACGAGPDRVVRNFYESIDKGDFKKFTETLDMRAADPAKVEFRFRAAVENVIKRDGIDTIEVNCEEKTDIAFCKTNVAFKGKGKEINSIKLIRVDGNWKIKLGG